VATSVIKTSIALYEKHINRARKENKKSKDIEKTSSITGMGTITLSFKVQWQASSYHFVQL
jgi:hypothetical protein